MPIEVSIPEKEPGTDGYENSWRLYPYEEYAEQYHETRYSVTTYSGDLVPYTRVSFGKTLYYERSTHTYTLTLIDLRFGTPLEITGVWEQERCYHSVGETVFGDRPPMDN